MKKIFILFISIGILLFLFLFDRNSSVFAQVNDEWFTGIDVWWECLNGLWKNCFRYTEIVWIDNESKKYTALSIVQDIIYAATYMVWTVLTAVIIWCGFWYIVASRWGKDTNAYKKWLINGAIWAILVLWAYSIVRLIQYIAKW